MPTHIAAFQPCRSQILYDVGILRQRQGQPAEACSLAERALTICAQSLGETHPETVALRTFYMQLGQEQRYGPEEEPATGQPSDVQALAGRQQEHLAVHGMRVAVRGATGQVDYARMVKQRDVTFTCTTCGQIVTQLHYPSAPIKYCSEACRAISAAQRHQLRVAKQREKRRIARGARLQAQPGNDL